MSASGERYRAVVLGSSGGIGAALVEALAADPACAEVAALSRSSSGFDLLDEATIAAAAADRGRGGPVDLVIDATGALRIGDHGPEKSLRFLDPAAMAAQFAVNAIGPALVFKHFAPLLPRGRASRMATLSARVGSIGDNRLGGWISYRASKAALNQIVRTTAIEVARTRPEAVVVALHPGTVATRLSDPFAGSRERFAPADAAAALLRVLRRLTPADTGGFFAYDGSPIEW